MESILGVKPKKNKIFYLKKLRKSRKENKNTRKS